jgi:hypothetical protein
MALPEIEPIGDDTLLEFCRFLTEHLSRERTAEAWAEAFRHDWGVDAPNHGFILRDAGRIVGGIGAIYAQRSVRGKQERFCNVTSWCVLDKYRPQSMRLAMALTSQPGYHYSDLTPTEVVSKTLQFLKFTPMNERQALWPNLPFTLGPLGRATAVADPLVIEQVLSPEDVKIYFDHRDLSWLSHLALGRPGDYCHVVYKNDRLKGLPGARVLAVSDPARFIRHRWVLGGHLLLRRGLLYTRIESRLLPRVPTPSIELAGYRNKVFRSDTLSEADISNLYTEIVALDL